MIRTLKTPSVLWHQVRILVAFVNAVLVCPMEVMEKFLSTKQPPGLLVISLHGNFRLLIFSSYSRYTSFVWFSWL